MVEVTKIGIDNRTTVPLEVRKKLGAGIEDRLIWDIGKEVTVVKFYPTKQTKSNP